MCGRYFVLDSKDVLFTSEKKYWSLCCWVCSLITCGTLAALTLVLPRSPGGRTPEAWEARSTRQHRRLRWGRPVLASAVLQVEVASGVGGQPRWEADPRALGKEALVSPSRGAVRRHVGAVRCDAFLEGDLVGISLIPSGQDFAFQNSPLLSCLKSRGSRL